MRNLKRFLALALTMLMVIGSFSISAKSFADTADMTADQINALDVLSDLSIFIGKEDGTFGGAEEINRKEMAILASRIQTGEKFGASYGENVTPFADVVSDFEAILYASNMGIVIGFEDGTFRPDDKVIYQDVLTMIVRTLGYNGAAMDAGYPSTYINKARELGITKGITSTVIPSWTSNVARQDVATLLYNALFAVKADGTTAAEFFGIDTYVVTAVEDYNLTGVTAYLANGTRVVVQPLNADGSINDMYYHIPVAAFEAAGLTPVHGASYRIASTDNMETIKAISALPSIELADDADMTAELYLDGTVVITGLDGKPVTYKAVERYTKVYNNQGTQKADNEIIVYNQRGFNWTTSGLYDIGKLPFNWYAANNDKTAGLLTDANGNLLDKWGYIVAYYMPELNGVETVYAPYYTYDEATGTYAPATEADIAKAAQAQDNSTVYHVWTGDEVDAKGNFVKPYSSFVITNKDDKYSAVAYDDNADGKYDRLAFMYHSFAESNFTNAISTGSVFGKGDHIQDPNAAANAFHTDSAVTPGELVRFYSDAARATVGRTYGQISSLWAPIATIVEKYETTTVSGMVTAVNGTKMTIGGKVYDIATMALHNFKDMIPYGKDTANKYIGQNVTAVLYDGGIYNVKGYENTWVIFEDYTGLTTNGYVTALAFAGSNDMKNITIASIDGYFFMYNNYNGFTHTGDNSFDTFYDRLVTGGLYYATVDTYGYYHLNSNANGIANLYYTFDNAGNNDGDYITYKFENGISSTVNFYYPYMQWYRWGNDAFDQWSDKNDWEFIIYNTTTKSFLTGDGLPNNGSKLSVYRPKANTSDFNGWFNNHAWGGGDANELVVVIGNVVYLTDAIFEGSFGGNSTSTVNHATDLVYLTAEAAKNFSVDNTVPGLGGAGETIWGFRYIYNEAVSMLDGSKVKIATDGIYNYKLEAGFYYINNGVVDHKVINPNDETNSAICRGTLLRGDKFSFKVEVANDTAPHTVYDRELSEYVIIHINADGSFTKYTTRGDHNSAHGWPNDNISVFFFEPTMHTNCPVIICSNSCGF